MPVPTPIHVDPRAVARAVLAELDALPGRESQESDAVKRLAQVEAFKEAGVKIGVREAVVLLDKAPVCAKVITAGEDTYVVPEWDGAFDQKAPEPMKDMSAQWDASDAARILSDLLRLKGRESDDADDAADAAMIDTAIQGVLDFIKAESTEIGAEEPVAESAKDQGEIWESLVELQERQFNTKKRQAMADAGTAMPDGSFPIANAGDLSNAVSALGRAKNADAAKAHIIKRARAMNMVAKLPASWGIKESGRRHSAKDAGKLKEILKLVGELGIAPDELKAEAQKAADEAEPETPVQESYQPDPGAKREPITFREGSVDAELVTLAEASARFDDATRTVWITPIKPGWGNARDNRYYPTKTLQEATEAGRFNHLKMYADHPTKSGERELPERSVKDWIATTREAEWDEVGQKPRVPLKVHDEAVYRKWQDAPEQVAFSVLGKGAATQGSVGGKKGVIVESIAKLRSVDWVTEAGAGGALDFAESAASEEFEMNLAEMAADMTPEQFDQLQEANPTLYKHLVGLAAALPAETEDGKGTAKAEAEDGKTSAKPETDGKPEGGAKVKESEDETEIPAWFAPFAKIIEAGAEREAEAEKETNLKEAKAEAAKTVKEIVGASTLPKAVKAAIETTFAEAAVGTTHESDEALKGAVTAQVKLAETMFKAATSPSMVRGLGGKPEDEEPTSIREAALREAETKLEERVGGGVARPRRDQLVFTPEQMAGATAKAETPSDGGETQVSESARSIEDQIAAKL